MKDGKIKADTEESAGEDESGARWSRSAAESSIDHELASRLHDSLASAGLIAAGGAEARSNGSSSAAESSVGVPARSSKSASSPRSLHARSDASSAQASATANARFVLPYDALFPMEVDELSVADK